MDKRALQAYAEWAKDNLEEQIEIALKTLGINSEKDIKEARKVGDYTIIDGDSNSYPADLKSKRDQIVSTIQREGYKHVIEEFAYTWFNRIVALRFMEVHDFIPHGFRVLSARDGGFEPEVLRNVAIMVSPVMPETSEKMFNALAVVNELQGYNGIGFGKTLEVKVLEKIDPMFVRLDMNKELAAIAALKEVKVKKLELKPEITIEDFEKIDLRVGKVVEAKKLEGSDKLLVLQVKIEEEVRQIVSGIAKAYKPEEMVGKYVVVVANLKPVKLRGVMSNGMILAASGSRKEALEVIEINKESEFAKVK